MDNLLVQFDTGKADLFFVKVPEKLPLFSIAIKADADVKEPQIIGYSTESKIFNPEFVSEVLPESDWQMLGNPFVLSEEVICRIVQESRITTHGNIYYLDYKSNGFLYDMTATESFDSLLNHLQVYKVNPFEFPGCQCDTGLDQSVYDKCLQDNRDWSSAEARTGQWFLLASFKK